MNSGKQADSMPRIYRFSRTAFLVSLHCICIIFTIFVTLQSRPGSSLFSWHPFLMTLAFSLFMTEAILIFSPHGFPIQKLTYRTKSRCHWILQGLCVSCAVLGVAAIYYNKHLNGKPHLTSWHGVLGAMTLWVVMLQSLAALPLLYPSLAKGWSLARLKRYHAATGMLTYLLGSVSLVLGLTSAWFTASVKGYAWYLAALCPALCALYIINQITTGYTSKKTI
ncbi:unnamed protein product, partial [Tetraodon nigroviridis]